MRCTTSEQFRHIGSQSARALCSALLQLRPSLFESFMILGSARIATTWLGSRSETTAAALTKSESAPRQLRKWFSRQKMARKTHAWCPPTCLPTPL
eukprot:scaffold253878_cov18-Tisochrysis_lutea.AAC.1